MIKIKPFKNDHFTYLNKTINSKAEPRKSLLKEIEYLILERYCEYTSNSNNLELIGNSPININVPSDQFNHKTSLIHIYESLVLSSKEYLKEIKKTIKEGHICPYCGINQAKTIDHFLPKSKFPEFSLFLPNLIVSCSDCNKSKDDIAINTLNESRYIINPYYDNIYDYDFLVCDIIPPYAAPKFTFEITPHFNVAQRQICLHHIEYLELETGIKTLWCNYFNELYNRLKKNYIKNQVLSDDELKTNFIELIQDEISTKNIEENIVHKAFFIACSTNNALLDYWLQTFRAL